jgi:D-tyrosyl-tRNA(Tyr) deacylase
MKVVIQRVKRASVSIDNRIKSSIETGLLILLGIEASDTGEDIEWLCKKIISMRIFNDADDKMNLSIQEVNGNVIVVSQFTLHASTKKGNRPSYIKAARPEIAIPLYEAFILEMENGLNQKVGSGEFGAMMDVELVNDGPVTILMDSKVRE